MSRSWVVTGRILLLVAVLSVPAACGSIAQRAEGPVRDPAARDRWATLSARVHAGALGSVRAELEADCDRGSGPACSAIADLVALGIDHTRDRGDANALYLHACGRAHAVACLSLDERVAWLTLPLLRPTHIARPDLVYARESSGADEVEVEICVDGHGVPQRVRLRGSTGRDVDDRRVVDAVARWRFAALAVPQPHVVSACDRFTVAL